MWRAFWISAAIVGSIVTFLTWVACSATFLFNHPKTSGYRVVIDNRTGGAVVTLPVSTVASHKPAPSGALGRPKAVALETEHHFGVMDPLTMGRHEFLVSNRGDAPLKLQLGPTTCKCTLSGLSRNEVGPGETATVTLEWNTGRDPQYSHAGTIQTNDPEKKWLEFRIRGSVCTLVGIDDPEVFLERVEPDEATVVERLIFSQILDRFAVTRVETSIAGLDWQIDKVDPASVPSLDAKSVARLRLTLPRDLPHGEISDTLRLVLHPSGDDHDEHRLEIPLRLRVLRRIGFYGAGIDESGLIDLGTVPEGKGAKIQLLVKVRGSQADLEKSRLDVSPSFLTARLEQHAIESSRGLYTLVVELDRDAPVCAYRAETLGQIRICTGSERLGDVVLPVSFVVLPRQPL